MHSAAQQRSTFSKRSGTILIAPEATACRWQRRYRSCAAAHGILPKIPVPHCSPPCPRLGAAPRKGAPRALAWPAAPYTQTTAPAPAAQQSRRPAGCAARASARGGRASGVAGRLLLAPAAARPDPDCQRVPAPLLHPCTRTWYGSCLMTSPCASMSAHSCLRAAVGAGGPGAQRQLSQRLEAQAAFPPSTPLPLHSARPPTHPQSGPCQRTARRQR